MLYHMNYFLCDYSDGHRLSTTIRWVSAPCEYGFILRGVDEHDLSSRDRRLRSESVGGDVQGESNRRAGHKE